MTAPLSSPTPRGPLAVELFCGSFGWSAGWLELGGRSVGFDLEHLPHHGDVPDGAELVLQNVLTLHGAQFKGAALIVASPPCQEFSFMAMPFRRGKQIAAALRGEGEFPAKYSGSRTIAELTALFDACFRIQREASEAAGRHIPMVVENVRGAQPWVGKAKANYGSFYLWGDVDMVGDRIIAGGLEFGGLRAAKRLKGFGGTWFHNAELGTTNPNRSRTTEAPDGQKNDGGSWFPIGNGDLHVGNNGRDGQTGQDQGNGVKCGGPAGDDWFAHHNRDSFFDDSRKVPGMNFHDFEKTGKPGRSFQTAAVDSVKQPIWFNDDKRRACKGGGDWFGPGSDCSLMRQMSSKSTARKAASAQIAKIPPALSSYIARAFYPKGVK